MRRLTKGLLLCWAVIFSLILPRPASAIPIAVFTGNTFVDSGSLDGTINYGVWPSAVAFGLDLSASGVGTLFSLFSPGAGSPASLGPGFVYAYQLANNGTSTLAISAFSVPTAGFPVTSWGFVHASLADFGPPSVEVTATNNLGVGASFETLPAGGSAPRTGASATFLGISGDADHVDPGVTFSGLSVFSLFAAGAPPTGFFAGPIACFTPPSPGVGFCKRSSIIVFTSPVGPGFATGTIIDAALFTTGLVPAPVPEPATLILVGTGMTAMGIWGRRKFGGRRS